MMFKPTAKTDGQQHLAQMNARHGQQEIQNKKRTFHNGHDQPNKNIPYYFNVQAPQNRYNQNREIISNYNGSQINSRPNIPNNIDNQNDDKPQIRSLWDNKGENGNIHRALNINSKMVEERQILLKQNCQASIEGGGRNGSQSHCSQKSIERYSSQKKRTNTGMMMQQPHVGKVLQYNEYHDESTHSNNNSHNSPQKFIKVKMRQSPKNAPIYKMETFQKNDSSPGNNTRQSEKFINVPAVNNVSSHQTEQNMVTFEQNLDMFIQKFKQTQQSASDQFKLESQISNEEDEQTQMMENYQETEERQEQQDYNPQLILSSSQKILKDSLSSSDFKEAIKIPKKEESSQIGAHQVRRGRHKRYETQIQIIKEENLDKHQKLTILFNSETKQGYEGVKNINDILDNYSNSNQSSVARFGFQSSNIRFKNEINQKQLDYSMSKNSPNDKQKQPIEPQGVFDISQRSTMMHNVIGPNHAKLHSGSKESQGDLNEMGLNQNNFKASPSHNLNLESDHESAIDKANRTKARARQNLQKLLIVEKDQVEEESNTGQHEGNLMDQMINKQSFSVNPRVLKKSSSNNGGSEPQGNFMQILCQYTQEQDMKQGHTNTSNHLVIENEALSKQNETLKQNITDKEKQRSDLEIQLKYEKIQSFKHKEKYRRERHNMKQLLQLLEKKGLKSYVQYCIQQQNNETTSKIKQSQTSNFSRYSVTSVPIFGSEFGGLSASALSKNSRMSNSQFSRSKSISPVNAYRFSTFHTKKRGHSFSNQTKAYQSKNDSFQTSGNLTLKHNIQHNLKQQIVPNACAPDSLGELSSSQNINQRHDGPFLQNSNTGWQTLENQSLRRTNDQSISNQVSHQKIGNPQTVLGSHNKNVMFRSNKHQISRTMGPATPVQELISPIDMEKLKNQQNIVSRNDLSSQRGYQIESSTNFADHIIANSSIKHSTTNVQHFNKHGRPNYTQKKCHKPPRTCMNTYQMQNFHTGTHTNKDMLSQDISVSQNNKSSIKDREQSNSKKLSMVNQTSLPVQSTTPQMPQNMYRTQQSQPHALTNLKGSEGQHIQTFQDKMKPTKQRSLVSKMNLSQYAPVTDGSVLYSERQQNSLDCNYNNVGGFEEHDEPSSSRNNTILASNMSSNDPDQAQIYVQKQHRNSLPGHLVQQKKGTTAKTIQIWLNPDQGTTPNKQYQNFMTQSLNQIQNENKTANITTQASQDQFLFKSIHGGNQNNRRLESASNHYHMQTMDPKQPKSLIEKFNNRKNSLVRNQSQHSHNSSMHLSSIDCRQQILQSIQENCTMTFQSQNSALLQQQQSFFNQTYTTQENQASQSNIMITDIGRSTTLDASKQTDLRYLNQEVEGHDHQHYLNQQNQWEVTNTQGDEVEQVFAQLNDQSEVDQEMNISQDETDQQQYQQYLNNAQPSQKPQNQYVKINKMHGDQQQSMKIAQNQIKCEEKETSNSKKPNATKAVNKNAFNPIIFTSQSDSFHDLMKKKKNLQAIKNQSKPKPQADFYVRSRGVQMETLTNEFNNNLFMTTEGHEQEMDNLIKHEHGPENHIKIQLEAVCEEKSSQLHTYRSGAEVNPPNSQVIHHETNGSSEKQVTIEHDIKTQNTSCILPYVSKSVSQSTNPYNSIIMNQKPSIVMSNIANQVKPPLTSMSKQYGSQLSQQHLIQKQLKGARFNSLNNLLNNGQTKQQQQAQQKPQKVIYGNHNIQNLVKNVSAPGYLNNSSNQHPRSYSSGGQNTTNTALIKNQIPLGQNVNQHNASNFYRGKKLNTHLVLRTNTLNSGISSEINRQKQRQIDNVNVQ